MTTRNGRVPGAGLEQGPTESCEENPSIHLCLQKTMERARKIVGCHLLLVDRRQQRVENIGLWMEIFNIIIYRDDMIQNATAVS